MRPKNFKFPIFSGFFNFVRLAFEKAHWKSETKQVYIFCVQSGFILPSALTLRTVCMVCGLCFALLCGAQSAEDDMPVFTVATSPIDMLPDALLQTAFLPDSLPLEMVRHRRFSTFDQLTLPVRRAHVLFWFRYKLYNPTTDTVQLYIEKGVQNEAAYWQIKARTILQSGEYGRWPTYAGTADMYPGFQISVRIPPQDTLLLYHCFSYARHMHALHAPLELYLSTEWRIHRNQDERLLQEARTVYWVVCGILGFMGLFFSLQYWQTGLATQGWYAAYLFALFLFFLYHLERLFNAPFLISRWPKLLTFSEQLFVIPVNITYVQFLIVFFDLRQRAPRKTSLLYVLMGLIGLIGLVLLAAEIGFYD